ncbi:hypothetical protein [Streptomyces sp. NPDC048603]|uniref:hypothetical protein n=1 Tax=Streptomyces sp. NPDC048603 TaxID=3365577 RepID=UPI00371FC15A
MTQSTQGGYPHEGAPWGRPPADADPRGYGGPPAHEAATQYIPPVPGDGPGYGYPQAVQEAATQYIPPVPGEGPAYGYPQPVQEAATQYIPPVPGDGPAAYGYPQPVQEAATQYIPPVQADAPGYGHPPAAHEAATQYMPPVPSGPGGPAGPGGPGGPDEAATQYIPPVPAGPGGPDEAATQYLPPVPAGPEAGHHEAATQYLPPIEEPVLRQTPPQAHPPQRRQPNGQRFQPAHLQQHQQPQHMPPQPPHPQQQYAYEEAEPPRRVSGGIIVAGVIGLAVAGLGVGALLSEPGKAQNNDPAAVSSVPSPTGSAANAAEAPVDPARAQAVQLDKLLADSNDSRAAVIKAVEDIKGCRNLDQAADDLRDAARQRDELVTRLQDVKVDKLPDHARLTASLTKAWKSSAAADRSYASWADDVAGGKDEGGKGDDKKMCKDGKARGTADAAAGNRSSGEATKAKEQAAVLWNRIAAKYQLTKRDKTQL